MKWTHALSLFVALSLSGSALAVPVSFSYTQTDATTGAGTITGTIDTTAIGGPGLLPFSGAMPLAAINQKDASAQPVPSNAVGFIGAASSSTAISGAPIGVHLGWSGSVELSAVSGADTYTIDVPLTIPAFSTPGWSYSVPIFDDNSGAGGTNDVNGGSFQVRGWIGDDGGGHRHSDGSFSWGAGADTGTAVSGFSTGSNALGDSLGITVGKTTGVTGDVFIDDVTFGGTIEADINSLEKNGVGFSTPTAGKPFDITVDIGPFLQDVQSGHIEVSGAGNNNNGTELVDHLVSTGTGLFKMSIDDTDEGGADVGRIDWRDAGNSPNSANDLVDLGEDFVKNNGGVINLTLDDLPAGRYTMTSYHIDSRATQSDIIDIDIMVDAGFGFFDAGADGDAGANVGGVGNLDTIDVTNSSAVFSFTANGVDPVRIVFDGRPSGDNETPFNGFRLEFTPVPEPATATLGLLALGGIGAMTRRRRA